MASKAWLRDVKSRLLKATNTLGRLSDDELKQVIRSSIPIVQLDGYEREFLLLLAIQQQINAIIPDTLC